MDAPQELVSPEQSQVFVLAAALLCALIGGALGWKRGGKKAALFAGAVGLSVWPLWKAHEWATRFDPRTGYFGLESVWLLLGEAIVFVALGALVGRLWHHLTGQTRE
jgi:Na+/proline symporter